MANDKFVACAAVSTSLLLLAVLTAAAGGSVPQGRPRRYYGSIFSFGDSYTDTGNNPVAFRRLGLFDPVMRPPYGATFFGRPTGRESDGRLVIDFVAESLGLPLVPPFLKAAKRNGPGFGEGANFAVGGATAIDAGFFHRRDDPPGVSTTFPLNTSLGVQMQWFEESSSSSIKPSSLFFVGAFGVNDYLLTLANSNKTTIPQITSSLVPEVVATISTAMERLITRHGARTLVVPGIIPLGCAPPVLVSFANRDYYDPRTGCLRGINGIATRHNALLRQAVRRVQDKQHPTAGVKIVYADFFGPVMDVLTSPAKFGFDEEEVFTLCCGGPGGRYNYNPKVFCGDPGAVSCEDPSKRVFWDGVHLTEAAYRHIAADIITAL